MAESFTDPPPPASTPPSDSSRIDGETALRSIVEGTAEETGERFFAGLVETLGRTLGTHSAWVTEYLPERDVLHALAYWQQGEVSSGWEHPVHGTPCEAVIQEVRLVHYPDKLASLYPDVTPVKLQGVVSYLGVPLCDVDGQIIGNLAVMDRVPMPEDQRAMALFRIFASRASAELRRVRAERELRDREERLRSLVDAAMDAIVEIDGQQTVTRFNPAAEKVFGCTAREAVGSRFAELLRDSRQAAHVEKLLAEVEARPEGNQSMWIPGGFEARRRDGSAFTAEATLSRYHVDGKPSFTLILRNVEDRLEAERKIRALTDQTEYLREEIRAHHNWGELLGRSAPFQALLHEIDQVAPTDTSVLILGETGTGKELIARAIHAGSPRRERPLIKVNCAAIPATLIESEFFGHARGAFTGATSKRDGRFALADRGTIFLDEIGELPLELQAKLLRVLQEGEFEPVGSAETRRVDVRVIAATNRDLARAAREGRFREDLYYRLAVFPLSVPSLRERPDDIELLASTFLQRFAHRLGRSVAPLTPRCFERLRAYPWPGNVRELMNVIERGVILARDGRVDLARSLPEITDLPAPLAPPSPGDGCAPPIRTVHDLDALERENIVRALETAGWRVAGENGAAALLGTKPSTLSSRMKALDIQRPR